MVPTTAGKGPPASKGKEKKTAKTSAAPRVKTKRAAPVTDASLLNVRIPRLKCPRSFKKLLPSQVHPPRPFKYSPESLKVFNNIVWEEDEFETMELSAICQLAVEANDEDPRTDVLAPFSPFTPPSVDWKDDLHVHLYADVGLPVYLLKALGLSEGIAQEWIDAAEEVNREVGLVA
ncbi:uncharacterized protein LAESUDRAFT_211103 [Laetiporus sulphureus 93-53]|uniref:Uncharacterized protein n=1 Tax=Laetiporus sulphureus 93-53 TaxID=1314785 RepID=A0A165DVE1_9APHY|nr:uncharacterized protein LAESUDRAFT_211103 [Laetiporus sulphureus 93-53]KZT05703.1 hypothetical protein LAESUDRAFT_211103 [Laetiporus sulphureus 93-53]